MTHYTYFSDWWMNLFFKRDPEKLKELYCPVSYNFMAGFIQSFCLLAWLLFVSGRWHFYSSWIGLCIGLLWKLWKLISCSMHRSVVLASGLSVTDTFKEIKILAILWSSLPLQSLPYLPRTSLDPTKNIPLGLCQPAQETQQPTTPTPPCLPATLSSFTLARNKKVA